jgi:hypothetical protein
MKKPNKRNNRREDLAEIYGDELVFMDGYDDCIVGIVSQFGRSDIVAYDLEAVLAKLQKDGMTEEEAVEYWQFNQAGAYVGEYTPAFVRFADWAPRRKCKGKCKC